MRVLIVGCGYVGLPLAARLAAAGHEVWGLRRSADDDGVLKASGIHPLTADITRPETLAKPGVAWDWVVLATSSKGAGSDAYETLYLGGTANVVRWLADSPPQRWLYLSSTSVYGQADGSEVTESSPTEPSNPSSRILLQVEQLVLEAGRLPRVR
jgi:nucleoside-diphosphate-sugar epimerase